MTKLDLVFERIRQLPEGEQDVIAAELEFLLKQRLGGKSALTDEQWREVDAALADLDEETVPHDEVMKRARAKLAE